MSPQWQKRPLKLEWTAPEYEYHEKSSDWYWVVGIISVALFFVALILNNFLFALLVLLGGFVLALHGARRPEEIRIMLDASGVRVGDRMFPHRELLSFWIEYDPPERRDLRFHTDKMLGPDLVILLGETDPNEVRSYLTQFVKEEHRDEPLVHSLSRMIGF